jgi:3-oxoadipate enol-lactonase
MSLLRQGDVVPLASEEPGQTAPVTPLEVISGVARLVGEVEGRGQTVVLVHAGIADSRMWTPFGGLLAEERRVVRYDLRGYGRTELPPGSFRHVDDLSAVIEATSDGPVHLIGASMGGRVALDLAQERPSVIRSLVLLGTVVSGFDADAPDPPLWEQVVAADREDDLDALADAETRMWLADPDGTRLPAALLDLVRDMDRIALRNERSGVADELPTEPPAADRLPTLDRPVLVVDGDLDLEDIRLAADLLADRLPDVERVRLTGVAHLPALERPAEVAALVRRFLSGVEG